MQKLFEKISSLVSPDAGETFLIIGLGNPGKEYRNNRHNVGFMVVDEIAKKLGLEFTRVQSKALFTKGNYYDNHIILAKPRTSMNLSGQSVGSLVRFFKLPLKNLLIVFDDADLSLEILRLRPEGGSSGHQGMNSITQSLGTQDFPRLRVGIGRPPGKTSTPNYVLQNFSKEEQEALPFVLDRASNAALTFISEGIVAAMNEYNQKKP